MTTELPYRLVKLASGVFSVHSVTFAETFHPVVGPTGEAEALYLRQMQLAARMQATREPFVVWDIGLGAAANVLTVLRGLREIPGEIQVISFDNTQEPLRFALQHHEELGYFTGYEAACETVLNQGVTEFQNGANRVHWKLVEGDFPTLISGEGSAQLAPPHAILFDAFSPATNPAMWTLPLFTALHRRLDPSRPCSLATYSRSTLLRVTLMLAGFFVGAGHATGKKEETTIATNTLELLESPLDKSWLERVKKSTSAEPIHEPVYRQQPLAPPSLERLLAHPQFTRE